MKLWLTSLTVLILSLSGCAAERIQLPDFEEAARDTTKVVSDPVEYSTLCEVPWTTAECYQRLDVFEDEAIDNKALAQLNADIARDGDEAYDLILAGAVKQQTVVIILEDMLQVERKDHFMDNVKHWALIILMAAGMVL